MAGSPDTAFYAVKAQVLVVWSALANTLIDPENYSPCLDGFSSKISRRPDDRAVPKLDSGFEPLGMSALISIIIPTYNRVNDVKRAIDSALEQTHQPCEVIVVDDGSSDATPELLAQYG